MRKFIFTLVLAIVSSVWTMSEAICITQRSSFPGDDSWYGGTLQLVGMPCEEGEVCPPCLTVALMMYGHTYYLAGDERMNSLQAQLDTIEYPAKALINGVYYKQGSFDFIYVEQLFLNPENQYRLPSLCDTWNVLMDNRFTLGSADGRCWTDRFKLQGDTIINNTKYAQMLYADGLYTYAQLQWNYYGSIRETENAEIYFIPAGQNKEYLLYAFNAKVGDIFKNLYGMIEGNDVWAEVKEVTEKEIVLELKGRYEDVEYTYFENYVWIKGVGANLALFQPLPSGTEGGPIINNLLCAYRNDELVYTSEYGEKYGCNYFGHTKHEIIDQLVGNWLLYKEDITGIYWDEQGNPINGTRSHEFNKDDYGFTFTEGTVVQFCPNYCSSTPFTYTLDDYGYKDWLLTIPGRFDTPQPSDPSISGFSPIIIHKLTYEEMELEYYVYGGDEGPYIHYQYLRKAPSQLPSLCDTWNVLENNKIYKYHLTTDTIIAGTRYVKLFKDNAYEGALREGDNRDIYCIPANKTHEYLLYAFNAQVRETLTNGWLVGRSVNYGDEYWFIIGEILETSPRIFVFCITWPGGGASGITGRWIEGVGAEYGPICNSGEGVLLCAYKNGELVYTSETGKEYGCNYEGGTQQDRLPSLCDEWNVLEYRYNSVWGGQDEFHTLHYTLKTDTLISNQYYSKLYKENKYLGALREGKNADIYYIPSDSTHEYLLYAFNVHIGDTLKNVWIGFQNEYYHLLFQNVIVKEIQTTNPRTFVLDVERKFINDEIVHGELKWLEGIGFLSSPDGGFFDPLAGGFFYNVLCAYTEGEQVYTSEMGQKYGCYYDGGTQQDRLPSLCDEWNVLMDSGFELGPVYGEIWTNGFKVQGDTIINNIIYSRLLFADGHQKKQRESREWVYYGALREAANAEIYFIPAGQNKEYLLYAFNAQVGDRIDNLLTDDYRERNVWAIVKEVSENEIILDFYEQLDDREDVVLHNYTWVKGIGAKRSMFQPIPIYSGGGVVNFLLCAYNDEKHIYTSEFGEKYGCYYDGGTQQAMFPSDTRWDYVHTEMYGGPDYKPTYFSVGLVDTLINHIRYQQISDALFRSTLGANDLLFRSKGAKVWCLLDSMEIPVERLVYDFDLQIGDSIRKWGTEDYLDPTPKYAKVTKVEKITLPDGRSARRLSYDDRPDDIEHIGSVDGIFAPLNLPTSMCGCGEHFLCCTRGDILLYEVAEGACDTFFVDNRPYADTIPLYKDGPGSSTVEPVDPNQIVAVLQVDVLSIFEYIGKEIGYKLSQTSSGNTPVGKRLLKSDTFHESVAVTLTENGTYLLELTHPDWDYTIVGTFEYMGGENAVINTEATVPSARKILRDGQLLIRKGDNIYTLTGVQIQ